MASLPRWGAPPAVRCLAARDWGAALTVVTPPGFAAAIENGNDPSPGDSAEMFQLITGRKAKVLLYNAQATSPVTQQVRALARQSGVPVVPVTETMPPAYRSYQAWQLAQATALLALDPSSQQSVIALLNRYRHEHGTTVVFVTHEITPVAGFVDRVLYVADGRWSAGTLDAVMTTQRLSALYGTHIDVIRVHGRIIVVGGDDPAGHHHLPDGDHTRRAGHNSAGRPPGGPAGAAGRPAGRSG